MNCAAYSLINETLSFGLFVKHRTPESCAHNKRQMLTSVSKSSTLMLLLCVILIIIIISVSFKFVVDFGFDRCCCYYVLSTIATYDKAEYADNFSTATLSKLAENMNVACLSVAYLMCFHYDKFR